MSHSILCERGSQKALALNAAASSVCLGIVIWIRRMVFVTNQKCWSTLMELASAQRLVPIDCGFLA
eukprot:1137672-Pelagomonas_calceolata.AAC.2